ncbi:MAG: glycoside hydrolase family 5 protein [Ignavibacteriales bacterium]|nr:glycoside hydrolase family 5 protein [Ignavibacteriales bacterium]
MNKSYINRKKLSSFSYLISALLLFNIGCSKDSSNPVIPTDNPLTNPLDPFEQNKRLGRGINLGNALEAPTEGEWGVVLKEEFFQLIKEKGFNSVRIPIRWSSHALTATPFTIDQKFFERIDWAINQSLSNGLAVVINIHHYEEMMTDPVNNKERFLSLWSQISARYANYSGDLFFELLNEPNNQLTPDIWNQNILEAIKIVREKNPYRTLIVSPANWSGVENLSTLNLPKDENNLIITFHYYNPFHFTHQGAEWVSGSNDWLGTKWLASALELENLSRDLDRALSWSTTNNRPLYLGEFGAYNKADLISRAYWTYYVSRLSEQRGFSWAYWEFCSGFGIYDQQTKFWNAQLLNALIPKNV